MPESTVSEAVTAFGEEGAAALIALLTAITMWNTVGVTTRCWSVSPA